MIRSEENVGGAGGFRIGMETAYAGGWDRIWLMDDDVVPAADCLETLMADAEHADCLMCVREDLEGHLVEKSATTFDLRNPLAVRPKTASVETTYGTREAMPPLVEIQVVAFEGFLVRRGWSTPSACPTRSSSSSTTTPTSRCAPARPGSGSGPCATPSSSGSWRSRSSSRWTPGRASTCTATSSSVHFRHGENALVRAKPYAITAAVVASARCAAAARRPAM